MSGFLNMISKIFRPVGGSSGEGQNAFQSRNTLIPILIGGAGLLLGAPALAAGAAAGGAAAAGTGILGSILTRAATTAATGAVLGGVTSNMAGGNWQEGAAKGAVVGGITGAVTGGVQGLGAMRPGATAATGTSMASNYAATPENPAVSAISNATSAGAQPVDLLSATAPAATPRGNGLGAFFQGERGGQLLAGLGKGLGAGIDSYMERQAYMDALDDKQDFERERHRIRWGDPNEVEDYSFMVANYGQKDKRPKRRARYNRNTRRIEY